MQPEPRPADLGVRTHSACFRIATMRRRDSRVHAIELAIESAVELAIDPAIEIAVGLAIESTLELTIELAIEQRTIERTRAAHYRVQ